MFFNPFSNQYPRKKITAEIPKQTEPNPIELPPIPSTSPSHMPTQMNAMMAHEGLPIVIQPNLAPCSCQLIFLNFQVSLPKPFEPHRMLYWDIGHQCHSQGYILSNVVFHHVRNPNIQMLSLTCTQQLCWLGNIPNGFRSPIWPEIGQKGVLVKLTEMSQGPTMDIWFYICRFEMEITWFVKHHLSDDTISYYFIQGF